jgi:hypothetical protein
MTPQREIAALGDFIPTYVGFGSWLCENAQTLERDRRKHSSKTIEHSNSQAIST